MEEQKAEKKEEKKVENKVEEKNKVEEFVKTFKRNILLVKDKKGDNSSYISWAQQNILQAVELALMQYNKSKGKKEQLDDNSRTNLIPTLFNEDLHGSKEPNNIVFVYERRIGRGFNRTRPFRFGTDGKLVSNGQLYTKDLIIAEKEIKRDELIDFLSGEKESTQSRYYILKSSPHGDMTYIELLFAGLAILTICVLAVVLFLIQLYVITAIVFFMYLYDVYPHWYQGLWYSIVFPYTTGFVLITDRLPGKKPK